ncbi:MAG: PDZ domain-containing protein [Alkalibacterium sp.]|uniref:PDZ domain-containing protein n=1 Tax=Alkalibacterium sp. TaxID=1872447 RepID=UPI00397054C2
MTLFQNIILALLLFVLQPTFIVGVILALLSKNRRFKYSRSKLRTTVYKENYEIKRLITWGLVPGAVISLFSVGIGMPVTIDWIIVYHIVTLLFLGLGYRFIHPIFTFSAAGLLVLGLSYFVTEASVFSDILEQWNSPILSQTTMTLKNTQGILVLGALLLMSTIVVLNKGNMNQFVPRFMKTKRGKLVARYRMTPLWLIPLVVIVPGETFTALFDWWPVFSMGNQTYSFLIIPVLLGFRYTVQAQLPSEAKQAIIKDFSLLSVLSVLLVGLSFWIEEFSAIGLGVLFVGGGYVLYRHRQRERKWAFKFGPDQDGLRVVAVRPNSPAERMSIEVGDVLVESNQMKLTSSEDLTESLFNNRSYSKLKLKRLDGELVMAETPIYEEDAHDLGLVTLEDIEY